MSRRPARIAIATIGVIALVGLAVAYARELAREDAEIDWLEQIPVLEHEPS